MLRYLVVFLVIGPFLISVTLAGSNPDAKVAIHVSSHVAKRICGNLPTINSCEDITYTYSGGGDVDFFVVFYDLDGYTGFNYSIDWPTEWSSCSFTSCSDFTIGRITEPGDSIAQTWSDCDYSGVCIPGFGWIGDIETSGHISVGPFPGAGIDISDCAFAVDTAVVFCRAGINGATGDDPCGGRGAGDGEGEGDELPALRIARVIEVTDGSTRYMQPIWSPDGKKLAFTTSGFTGVYVRNADGSGPIHEVTSADYSGFKPLWTPDSRALVLRTRTGIVGQSITSIDVETGEVKTIVEHAVHPGQPGRNAYGDVTVNIDGRIKVLDTETGSLESMDSYYSGERPSSQDIRLEIDFRNRRMWIVEGDGTRRSEFPHQVMLATLSPARDRVAFGKADPNLYVSDVDGSSFVNLGPGESWGWSPDGQRIVYVSAIDQNEWTVTAAELFVANADGSEITQLTNTLEEVESYPVWSPDGSMIAYSTVNTGKIFVAFLDEIR